MQHRCTKQDASLLAIGCSWFADPQAAEIYNQSLATQPYSARTATWQYPVCMALMIGQGSLQNIATEVVPCMHIASIVATDAKFNLTQSVPVLSIVDVAWRTLVG